MKLYEIPLQPKAQRFYVTLSTVLYAVRLTWNVPLSLWVLDLYDENDVLLLGSLPLSAGADMLGPYAYLGIPGGLWTLTDGDNNASPTFDNLGVTSHLYYIVP